jgi:hypothetical protein
VITAFVAPIASPDVATAVLVEPFMFEVLPYPHEEPPYEDAP